MEITEIIYSPLGIIHSPFTEKDHTPIQSRFSQAAGTVEVFPRYAEGLRDIEGFSHLFLIYHLHRTEECTLLRKPFLDGLK
jgi:tRNA (adenine37-N6)-methyltransferase